MSDEICNFLLNVYVKTFSISQLYKYIFYKNLYSRYSQRTRKLWLYRHFRVWLS